MRINSFSAVMGFALTAAMLSPQTAWAVGANPADVPHPDQIMSELRSRFSTAQDSLAAYREASNAWRMASITCGSSGGSGEACGNLESLRTRATNAQSVYEADSAKVDTWKRHLTAKTQEYRAGCADKWFQWRRDNCAETATMYEAYGPEVQRLEALLEADERQVHSDTEEQHTRALATVRQAETTARNEELATIRTEVNRLKGIVAQACPPVAQNPGCGNEQLVAFEKLREIVREDTEGELTDVISDASLDQLRRDLQAMEEQAIEDRRATEASDARLIRLAEEAKAEEARQKRIAENRATLLRTCVQADSPQTVGCANTRRAAMIALARDGVPENEIRALRAQADQNDADERVLIARERRSQEGVQDLAASREAARVAAEEEAARQQRITDLKTRLARTCIKEDGNVDIPCSHERTEIQLALAREGLTPEEIRALREANLAETRVAQTAADERRAAEDRGEPTPEELERQRQEERVQAAVNGLDGSRTIDCTTGSRGIFDMNTDGTRVEGNAIQCGEAGNVLPSSSTGPLVTGDTADIDLEAAQGSGVRTLNGDTLSDICQDLRNKMGNSPRLQIYQGAASCLAMIGAANPNINNLDRIGVNQEIRIPTLECMREGASAGTLEAFQACDSRPRVEAVPSDLDATTDLAADRIRQLDEERAAKGLPPLTEAEKQTILATNATVAANHANEFAGVGEKPLSEETPAEVDSFVETRSRTFGPQYAGLIRKVAEEAVRLGMTNRAQRDALLERRIAEVARPAPANPKDGTVAEPASDEVVPDHTPPPEASH